MKTRIYWVVQYSSRRVSESRFKFKCWWLNQQVEFLEWQLNCREMVMQCVATGLNT